MERSVVFNANARLTVTIRRFVRTVDLLSMTLNEGYSAVAERILGK